MYCEVPYLQSGIPSRCMNPNAVGKLFGRARSQFDNSEDGRLIWVGACQECVDWHHSPSTIVLTTMDGEWIQGDDEAVDHLFGLVRE